MRYVIKGQQEEQVVELSAGFSFFGPPCIFANGLGVLRFENNGTITPITFSDTSCGILSSMGFQIEGDHIKINK